MDGKKIIELKQERANLTTNLRALMNEFENKEMPAEKKTEQAKMEARFDELNGLILAEEKQLERERIIGEAKEPEKKNLTDKEKEVFDAFKSYLIEGSTEALKIYNALQQDNPTQAGYLVAPEKFVAELIKEKDNILFLRNKAKKFTLDKAQSLGFPKRTSRMARAAWGTEIQAPTPDTSLAFGKREFKGNPVTAEILVSRTLVRNAAINAEGIIRAEMAFAFAELEEVAFMTGSGSNQPLGLFTASKDGISTLRDVSTGNTTTEIKFDGLIEAKYGIKQQYWAKLEWIFHRDACKQIAKIKDGDGQYIWQQSVQVGQPDRLLSFPVNMSEYAPNTFTTGLYAGLLGDMSNYWIVDSLAMEMQTLMELYARTNQVDYIGREDVDGMPVLEEAFARVKLA